MKKILLFIVLLNISLHSKESDLRKDYTKNEIVNIANEYRNFECISDKKIFKIIGKNFHGNILENFQVN